MKFKRHTPRFVQVLVVAAFAVISLTATAQGNNFNVLHNFGGSGDGTLPSGPPVLDGTGNLYGVTFDGGSGVGCNDDYGCGVAFELTPGSGGWTETILHNFDSYTDGDGPIGPVVLDLAGNLYSVTGGGGPPGDDGTVVELSRADGWASTIIYDSGSRVGLLSDKAGNLYGFLGGGQYHAGAIGELSPGTDGWVYAQLSSFGSNGGRDGWEPLAPLSWDAKGDLYGTTYSGGGIGLPNCIQGDGCGVAFELSRNRSATAAGLWTYHVMHRFASTPTDGQNPNGGLTLDSQGNAYGTTPVGGAQCAPVGCGTIFKLTPFPAGPWLWTETILYDFPAAPPCSLGCAPAYNLVFDKAGNLYGVAGGGDLSCGGTCGVVFKMTPGQNGQWSYSVIHEFDGTDGSGPLGLAIDGNGNLFGATMTGGTYNLGVAFEITP